MGRVIVGCGNGTGLTTRAPGDTGGEETHLLTVGEIPAHTHDASYNAAYQALTAAGSFAGYGFLTTPSNASGSTGGGLAHQNMPPYNCIYPVIRTARTI
jgi:microcystin-dependent protein